MKTLTEVVSIPEEARQPLMLEVPVAKELDGPFLVTSAKGLMWVSDKFPSGVVRSAVRKVPIDFLYREALLRVAEMSKYTGWGSCIEAREGAVTAAQEYLSEYGFEKSEVLRSSDANWVPEGWVVVLPKDRSYLGTSFTFGGGKASLVVHNASRALAFVVPPHEKFC